MTRHEIIQELQTYSLLVAKIEALEREIATLNATIGSYGNSIGDGMPHATNSTNDARYTKQINRLVDAERELLEERSQLIQAKDYILQLIELAPTKKGRYILEMRYRYGWSVKKISETTNRSDTNVRDLQNRAIDRIIQELEKARA